MLTFKHLDTFLFSLDPNTYFSPISFFPLIFQPYPSFNFLVSVLNPLFFTFFMHFMHLDLGFLVLENFGVFVFLLNFLGWVLFIVITCSWITFYVHYNIVSCILGLSDWFFLVSVVRLDWVFAYNAIYFCTSYAYALPCIVLSFLLSWTFSCVHVFFFFPFLILFLIYGT